ncbi:MAG: hypothetical protein KAT05_13430 [Spirochaetes bacterium]|nr:hypothetical protein [Spirochaetota bacterium]
MININIEVPKTILFTIAVTGMMSGWSYFYLPYLISYIPENYFNQDEFSDPRALNRLQINRHILEKYLKSDYSSKTFSLIETLNKIHLSQGEYFKTNCFVEGQLLILTTIDKKFKLMANFSKSKEIKIPEKHFKGEVLEKNDLNNSTLGCFGFVIMSLL